MGRKGGRFKRPKKNAAPEYQGPVTRSDPRGNRPRNADGKPIDRATERELKAAERKALETVSAAPASSSAPEAAAGEARAAPAASAKTPARKKGS